MNTYLGNVFDFNEHLINLGLWNRDFGDREPVGLRYGRQPLIRNETDDYSIRRPTKLLNNLTDLVLGPCLHSLRDLESAFPWTDIFSFSCGIRREGYKW